MYVSTKHLLFHCCRVTLESQKANKCRNPGACHLNVHLHWRSFPAPARSLHCVLQKGSDKGVAGAKVHPCIFAALHSGSYCIYMGPFLGVMITSLVASKLLCIGGQ